ncbi:hypothetical protein BJ508DRAFT_308263 [Ascobolus immersus RN42]|uniref:C2H2-type domain-containing protein n=1 Tax=Ascobolus immersus RN42 TaxID=1160509 RepID=A0A3N4ICR2_ASCIM|nr:hypothetical protein BJ508DRAFT_308263 [Ascobolus immersus RN42]
MRTTTLLSTLLGFAAAQASPLLPLDLPDGLYLSPILSPFPKTIHPTLVSSLFDAKLAHMRADPRSLNRQHTLGEYTHITCTPDEKINAELHTVVVVREMVLMGNEGWVGRDSMLWIMGAGELMEPRGSEGLRIEEVADWVSQEEDAFIPSQQNNFTPQHLHQPNTTNSAPHDSYGQECEFLHLKMEPNEYICSRCNTQFDNQAQLDNHLSRPSSVGKPVVVSYTEKPLVTVKSSADGKFYCIVQDCDFSHHNECQFGEHCFEHKPPFQLSGEYLWVVTKRVRDRRERGGWRDEVSYFYKKIIVPAAVKQAQVAIAEDASSSNSNSPPDANTPTSSEAAASESDISTSPPSPSARPDENDAGTLASTPPTTDTVLAPATQEASAEENGRRIRVEEVKEIIKAEYHKAVLEEVLKNLRDPDADIDASVVRMEKKKGFSSHFLPPQSNNIDRIQQAPQNATASNRKPSLDFRPWKMEDWENDLICSWCEIEFESKAEIEKHFARPSRRESEAIDCYGSAYWVVPDVYIACSADGKFYCAVKTCTFSSRNKCLLLKHCFNHTTPILLKDEAKIQRKPSVPTVSSYLTSTSSSNSSTAGMQTPSEATKTESESTSGTTTPSFSSSQSEANVTTPTTITSPTTDTLTPPATQPESTAGNTESREHGIEEMKERLTAEFKKVVFEDVMRNLRGSEADIDGSVARMYKLKTC